VTGNQTGCDKLIGTFTSLFEEKKMMRPLLVPHKKGEKVPGTSIRL